MECVSVAFNDSVFRSCLPATSRLQLLARANLGAHNRFLGAKYVLVVDTYMCHLAFWEKLLLVQCRCVKLACVLVS